MPEIQNVESHNFRMTLHTKSNNFTLIITKFVKRVRSFSFAKLIFFLDHKIHGIR